MVGQLLLSEIPNLNLLVEDEVGIAVCHQWEGKNVIHSEIYEADFTLEKLKEAKKRSDAIDNAFRSKGVTELFTWGENEQHRRYNLFLGYKPTGRIMNYTFVDKDYPFDVMEYKKDLV